MQADALPASPRAWHTRVWQLTWPVILANITIPLVGVADVAVMGRLPDPAYIGAVAMGAAMFSAVYWLFGFLRMGTTGLVAQSFGGNALNNVVAVWLRAVCVGGLLGLVIVAAQFPLQLLLFDLFDASAKISALATHYYTIRIYGAPALLVYLVCLGALFGLQKMRATLVLSVGLNLTNFVLDIVLVLVFDMGVRGVALGTVISEWLAAAGGVAFVYHTLKNSGWQGKLPVDLWQSQALKALFHVSGNLIIRTFFVQLPFFVGTVVATRLGDLTLAAHGVLMQLFFVMTYSLDGFAHTAETLAGYTYGAKAVKALRATTYYCAIWAMLLAALTALSYWFGGAYLISWLTLSPDVQQTATEYLPWLAISPLLCVWAFLLDGIFIGTTHIVEMRNAMFVAAGLWAVTLAGTYTSLGYHAVWLTMCVFMVSRGILLGAYYPRIERGCADASSV